MLTAIGWGPLEPKLPSSKDHGSIDDMVCSEAQSAPCTLEREGLARAVLPEAT